MKTLTYISLLFLFVLNACDKKETPLSPEEQLIGKWKLIKFCEGGASGEFFTCNDVIDGHILSLDGQNNFLFIGNNNPNCSSGSFEVNNDQLILYYNNTECINGLEKFTYYFKLSNNELELGEALENTQCIEGCLYIYKKTDE